MTQLRDIGALKTGHFLLASGRHSDIYLEKFDLLRNPRATEDVCAGFVEAFRDTDIDVVVGPTTGGVLLAYETARQMGLPAAYAERAKEGSDKREIRRGTTFPEGARVLVVDDILTTGGSVRETLAALKAHPVEVVGIGVLVDRSGGEVRFGDVPLRALTQMKVDAWEPVRCPLCTNGVPLEKPGTTVVPNNE
ncbi:MAG TPA: orotate phosphoribosyltransferase [Thermomicrobiales bacterium]|nr:orotate phosphoribosyltransferase [Thermomicrobiales bacterium]